jgi:hypothetical protein
MDGNFLLYTFASMTTRYQQYLDAHQSGKITASTRFGVKLCYQDYEPKETDKIADLKSVVLSVSSAMTWGEVSANGMEWILTKLKERAKTYIAANQDKVATWCAKFPNKEVLELALKSETLDLKETGIKWIVVYCPAMNINCFCDELT